MAAVRVWDTAALPEGERLPFWREVVWEAFAPVSVSVPSGERFRGRVEAGRLGPLTVATIAAAPQVVARTPAHVAHAPGDVYFLNLPLTAGTSACQDGRTACLEPGDFVLVDGARPFELAFHGPFRQVSLVLPRDLLGPALGDAGDGTAVTVSARSGAGAVAAAGIRALADRVEAVGDAEARELARYLAQLVALAVSGAHLPRRGRERRQLRQAVVAAAERALADPALCPSRVAAEVGISVRHLHQLFAGTGTTFGRWLLDRRLELCHRDLRDPALRDWTIGELAARHGLADPSHFSRAFRARYGVTPREARRSTGG